MRGRHVVGAGSVGVLPWRWGGVTVVVVVGGGGSVVGVGGGGGGVGAGATARHGGLAIPPETSTKKLFVLECFVQLDTLVTIQ